MPSLKVRNRAILRALKDAPCTDCEQRFRPEAMDFDHVRGVKLADVSSLLSSSTGTLLAEVAKCELVCATCHRIRTAERQAETHVEDALWWDILLDGP